MVSHKKRQKEKRGGEGLLDCCRYEVLNYWKGKSWIFGTDSVGCWLRIYSTVSPRGVLAKPAMSPSGCHRHFLTYRDHLVVSMEHIHKGEGIIVSLKQRKKTKQSANSAKCLRHATNRLKVLEPSTFPIIIAAARSKSFILLGSRGWQRMDTSACSLPFCPGAQHKTRVREGGSNKIKLFPLCLRVHPTGPMCNKTYGRGKGAMKCAAFIGWEA